MKHLLRILALLVFLSSSSFAGERQELVIGGLLHLTGEWAPQGQAFLEGIELAAEEINQNDSAFKIRLSIEDTKYIPLETNKGAKRLKAMPKLDAVLTTCVSETKTAAPVFQDSDVPIITLWDSSPELENLGDNIFGIGSWGPSSGEVGSKFAVDKLGAKTAVIINSNTDWSQSVSKGLKASFLKNRGELLEVFSNDPKETDYRTVLTRVKGLKPDVIFAPLDGNILTFYKQLYSLGIKIPVISSDVIAPDFIEEDPAVFEGVYQTQTTEPMNPQAKAMVKSYTKKFKRSPKYPLFTAWGYDAVYLVLEAAAKNTGVTASLYAIKDFPGASGRISINDKGSSRIAVSMFQIQNSEFVLKEY